MSSLRTLLRCSLTLALLAAPLGALPTGPVQSPEQGADQGTSEAWLNAPAISGQDALALLAGARISVHGRGPRDWDFFSQAPIEGITEKALEANGIDRSPGDEAILLVCLQGNSLYLVDSETDEASAPREALVADLRLVHRGYILGADLEVEPVVATLAMGRGTRLSSAIEADHIDQVLQAAVAHLVDSAQNQRPRGLKADLGPLARLSAAQRVALESDLGQAELIHAQAKLIGLRDELESLPADSDNATMRLMSKAPFRRPPAANVPGNPLRLRTDFSLSGFRAEELYYRVNPLEQAVGFESFRVTPTEQELLGLFRFHFAELDLSTSGQRSEDLAIRYTINQSTEPLFAQGVGYSHLMHRDLSIWHAGVMLEVGAGGWRRAVAPIYTHQRYEIVKAEGAKFYLDRSVKQDLHALAQALGSPWLLGPDIEGRRKPIPKMPEVGYPKRSSSAVPNEFAGLSPQGEYRRLNEGKRWPVPVFWHAEPPRAYVFGQDPDTGEYRVEEINTSRGGGPGHRFVLETYSRIYKTPAEVNATAKASEFRSAWKPNGPDGRTCFLREPNFTFRSNSASDEALLGRDHAFVCQSDKDSAVLFFFEDNGTYHVLICLEAIQRHLRAVDAAIEADGSFFGRSREEQVARVLDRTPQIRFAMTTWPELYPTIDHFLAAASQAEIRHDLFRRR